MALRSLRFYNQSVPMREATLKTQQAIEANEGYFRVWLVDMRLGTDRRWGAQYVPAFHTELGLDENFQNFFSPLPEGDVAGNLQNVVISKRLITPQIPYRGKGVDAACGLFALTVRELIDDMLKVLGTVAGALQRPEVAAAAGIAGALKDGVESVLGLSDSQQILRWVGTIGGSKMLNSQFVVVGNEALVADKSRLSLRDARLLQDGRRVDNTDYFVFYIQVSQNRSDWEVLPEIEPHLNTWNKALTDPNISKDVFNQYVKNLIDALNDSPNLVDTQVNSIIGDLKQKAKAVEEASPQALFRDFDPEAFQETSDEPVFRDFDPSVFEEGGDAAETVEAPETFDDDVSVDLNGG